LIKKVIFEPKMLFLSALLISLVLQASSVAVWQQCGGKEYTGDKYTNF
jgi:hypothetical protein